MCQFLFGIVLFHSDFFYLNYKNKLNEKVIRHIGFDLINAMNRIGEFFDIKGYYIQESIEKENIVSIQIDDENGAIFDSLKIRRDKSWIKAKIQDGNEWIDVKLKLHGSSSIHYNDGKYSYRVKMKGSKLFEEMKEFTLIKTEDVSLAASAANLIAEKLGLIATSGRVVSLVINDGEVGSYYLVEKVKSYYLSKVHGMKKTATIVNENDWTRKDNLLRNSPHMSDQDLFHGHVEAKKGKYQEYAISRYKDMTEAVKSRNVEVMTKYFDADYMGRFLALASIFNDVHFMSGDNLNLIYNHENGKFYPLFRKETGVNLFDKKVWRYKDVFKYHFPNYNKILFECQPDAKDAENLKIFKTALANNKIRSKRDIHLLSIIDAEEYYNQIISDTYAKNRSILLSDDYSRRAIDIEELEFKSWTKKLICLANEYLNYARIYGSYDKHTNNLDIVADSYSTIILEGGGIFEELKGISFNTILEPKYNYITINLDSVYYKDLIFKHQDRILGTQHVFINVMSSEVVNYKEEVFFDQ